MILVREMQELRRDSQLLEDIERGESLAHGQTVIQLSVDYHLRRRPVLYVAGGVPAFVACAVGPEGSLELLVLAKDGRGWVWVGGRTSC